MYNNKLDGEFFEKSVIDGRIIFKIHLKGIRCVGMYWINPAQDSDKWRTVVNTLMNSRFQYNGTNFVTTRR